MLDNFDKSSMQPSPGSESDYRVITAVILIIKL